MKAQELELKDVVIGQLPRFSGSLAPGLYTLLDTDALSLDALAAALAGLRRPTKGRIRVGGLDPFCSPTARRRIGALLRHEPLPVDRARITVERHVEGVLAARRDGRSAHATLAEFSLEAWQNRPLAQLEAEDRRTLAKCLALSTPDPLLIVLHEPRVGAEPSISLDARLAALASRAVVLAVTSNPLEARKFAGTTARIEAGQLRLERQSEHGQLLEHVHVVVRIHTPRPEDLVRILASVAEARVSSISWDGRHGSNVVVFEGHPGKALLSSVLRQALALNVPILALDTSPSPWPGSASHDSSPRVVAGSTVL